MKWLLILEFVQLKFGGHLTITNLCISGRVLSEQHDGIPDLARYKICLKLIYGDYSITNNFITTAL